MNNGEDCPKTLKPAQIRALKAVFLAPNIKAGLKTAQVARRTFYDWIANDETFRNALDESRRTLLDKGRVELEGLLFDAVEALGDALKNTDPEIKIRAAKEIINFILKYKVIDLEHKIDRILERLEV